ncbi:uncharacterized protein LOC141666373 [Apium graveolens]|uniref:uncharacterized protein LOC141666373 n=1 Tax=Apium graveolens TaxID=4045 RepID=UPI003D7ACD5B
MDYDSWVKFLHVDFGCGFLLFGCFSEVSCLLGLFFLINLAFNLLQFDHEGILSFKCSSTEKSKSKILSCISGILNLSRKPNRRKIGRGDDDSNCFDDKEELNVVKLRNLVKIERDRADLACLELEKERMAAASAAEETMAMILRVQNEKSLVEMEAKQYRRLAEEKQLHDKDVIQSLRRIATKYKTEKNWLEDQVMLMKQKLQVVSEDADEDRLEGIDESLSFRGTSCGDAFEDGLISSLDSAL